MDFELLDKSRDFLTFLQQLEFVDSASKDRSKQADAHRNIFLHLARSSPLVTSNRARFSNLQSEWMVEADKYKDKYAKIVDNMDDSGLNNYAEGSLALCNYHKNESTKWKTSLTVNKILQMFAQNKNAKESKTEIPEDFVINMQITRTPTNVPPVVDQGLHPNNFQPSNVAACSEESQRQQWLLKQQSPTWPPYCFTGPNMNNGNKTSSTTKGESRQGTNIGWLQPVVSPGPLGTFTKQSESMSAATAGNLRNGSHNLPGTAFQDHTQGPTRNEHQRASGESLINASKIGGPYANFGQKPKSSLWASTKDLRMEVKHSLNDEDDEEEEEEESHRKPLPFRTAKEQLVINQQKKYGSSGGCDRSQVLGASYGAGKKSLGTRRGPASKFVPPVLNRDSDENESPGGYRQPQPRQRQEDSTTPMDEPVDERLKGIEQKMIELINNEIMDHGKPVLWSDIAGLEFAKKTIKEIVVWPMLRPDIFTGLRGPPKGLLLFGPPGTGKTLIGKCVASQSKSTFFCISASSLTSKWVGEGEKMVRALFAVARCHQPAVVFIDEIDSLLSQRSDSEHESSRRIKTEFLVQLDGAATNSDDRILVIGATNRPQEIDEAARRRFVKRLLIPLPEAVARQQIITNLMSHQNCSLTHEDVQAICDKTDGYSGADMTNLCREAALGPIRSIPFEMMETITPEQVRPILYQDFEEALLQVRASVSSKDLQLYIDWNQTYGSFGL